MAFDGGAVTFVGRGYAGEAGTELDGSGFMVMPGLVNIHSHPSSEAMNKGLLDEIGSPGLYNSSLFEYMPLFRPDAEAVPHCVRVALSELLLSGVTTVTDLSVAHAGWLDLLGESGLRVCVAPMFRSARWFTRNGHVVEYDWDEPAGERATQTLGLDVRAAFEQREHLVANDRVAFGLQRVGPPRRQLCRRIGAEELQPAAIDVDDAHLRSRPLDQLGLRRHLLADLLHRPDLA